MKFVVLADDENWDAINTSAANVTFVRVNSLAAFLAEKKADAYFNLMNNSYKQSYKDIQQPIFINSVSHTLHEINATQNIIRVNGWVGFIEKNIWEIAGKINEEIENILHTINKKFIVLPDIAGFVSARTIAMIINEAYFALCDNVSTKKEIDIAMKLGTNYPFGPFEWADKIGLDNVFELLLKLSKTDERYLPSNNLKDNLNTIA